MHDLDNLFLARDHVLVNLGQLLEYVERVGELCAPT